MTAHPLLAQVLGEAMDSLVLPSIEELVAAIPGRTRDRLERALDVCQRPVDGSRKGLLCDAPAASWIHEHEAIEEDHEPRDGCHPYQPLIEDAS